MVMFKAVFTKNQSSIRKGTVCTIINIENTPIGLMILVSLDENGELVKTDDAHLKILTPEKETPNINLSNYDITVNQLKEWKKSRRETDKAFSSACTTILNKLKEKDESV